MLYANKVTRALNSPSADVWAIHRQAKLDRERGYKVYFLTEVDPDFPMPEIAKEAIINAIEADMTHYGVAQGTPRLRQAIARWETELNTPLASSVQLTEDNVVVFSGAQHALDSSLRMLVEEGVPVFMSYPAYANFFNSIQLCGGTPVPVSRTDDGRLNFEQMHSAVVKYLDNYPTNIPRPVILLANPDNPTGHLLDDEEMRRLAHLCARQDLVLIIDEIYAGLAKESHLTPLTIPGMFERTILIDGLSKVAAFSGARIGWTVASKEVTDVLIEIADWSHVSVPEFIQQAAIAVLEEHPSELEAMREEFIARKQLAMDILGSNPYVKMEPPEFGMFTLVYIRMDSPMDSMEFTRQLYQRTGVVVLAGSAFGIDQPCAIRLSLTIARVELQEAVQLISDFISEIGNRT